MKHHKENSCGGVARVRVTVDMLPKQIQRAGRDKQLDVMKKMLKRLCNISGHFHEMKEHEHYIKPGERRRRDEKRKKAIARGEIKDQNDFERDNRYFDEFNV